MEKLSTDRELKAEIDKLDKRVHRLELLVAYLGHDMLTTVAGDVISKDDARSLRNAGKRSRPIFNVVEDLPGQFKIEEMIVEIEHDQSG